MRFILATFRIITTSAWAASAGSFVTAAAARTPTSNSSSPSSSPPSPSDARRACQTFVVQARNGTYKGMYLGPSDPVSIEIANVSEASRFVYNARNGSIQELHSPPWLLAVTDEPYNGLSALDYDGVVYTRELIAKCSFDYWPSTYKFAYQNATQPGRVGRRAMETVAVAVGAAQGVERDDEEEEEEEEVAGEEDLSPPFFLPYGPFRCHNNAGAHVFTDCRETGMFVGLDKDARRFPGCEQVELFAIPTCVISE